MKAGKLRILVLNLEYPPVGGGASPVSREIAVRLVQRGHQVHFVTMGYDDLPTACKDEGIHLHRVPSIRKKAFISYPHEHLYFLYQAKKYLHKLLSNTTFDVCHSHFILPVGWLARWVRRHFDIPYVITAHGSDLPGYNDERFTMLHRFTPPWIRKVLADASYITTPSHYLTQLLEPFRAESEGKQCVIPNGIESERYIPGQKKPVILSSGRLLRRKGFHHLLEAVRHIRGDWEIHILGEGPMLNQLRQLGDEVHVPVIFHGWLDREGELYRQLLASASIYSLVSEKENASISLLEAMSAACAVISANTSGCLEMVHNVGYCLPPNDSQALEQTILRLQANAEERTEMGQRARAKVLEKYDWEVITDQYERLLFDISQSG